MTGQTLSVAYETTNALQASISSDHKDAFVTKLTTLQSLLLMQDGAQLRACWPAPSPEFVLESSDSLEGPWNIVSSQPFVASGLHQVVLPATASCRFFRLRFR